MSRIVQIAKGITCSAPGINTGTSGYKLEIETFSIDYGTQEFEDNNDIARSDDYVEQETTSKRYGTLTVSGKGTWPDSNTTTTSSATLGSSGAISITGPQSASVYSGYGIVQNYKNDLNSRQKPTFSVTYQIIPTPASSSGSGGSGGSTTTNEP